MLKKPRGERKRNNETRRRQRVVNHTKSHQLKKGRATLGLNFLSRINEKKKQTKKKKKNKKERSKNPVEKERNCSSKKSDNRGCPTYEKSD